MKKIAKYSVILFVCFWTIIGYISDVSAQKVKPPMKLGAYYFAGWSGKCTYDDGTPENAWAKGMPSHYTKKLGTEFAGRTPIWGWRDDTQELMERQIKLASESGVSYFSFCWYWADNKGPINVKAIENDSKHLPMNLFMKAKNNKKMEFCLLVANHSGFEIIGPEAWKQAADYWMTLFKHPRYLKIDGKPLLVIIVSQGPNNKVGLAYLQELAHKEGFPGVEVAYCYGEGKLSDGFTLRTNYKVIPTGTKTSEKHLYSEIIQSNVKSWCGTREQPIIPLVTQGWDPRPWDVKGWYYEKGTPEEFGDLLEKMNHWMDANPEQVTKDRLGLIYAWNEIGEGGWLVPCKDDPKGEYLKAIQRVVFDKSAGKTKK